MGKCLYLVLCSVNNISKLPLTLNVFLAKSHLLLIWNIQGTVSKPTVFTLVGVEALNIITKCFIYQTV